VIVHDFHIQCITATPNKADAPLIVNPDAVLTVAIPAQGLQMISRRRCQIAQFRCAIELAEFPLGNALKTLETPAALAVKKSFGIRVAKGLDHQVSV
jgi:hypothetical protein